MNVVSENTESLAAIMRRLDELHAVDHRIRVEIISAIYYGTGAISVGGIIVMLIDTNQIEMLGTLVFGSIIVAIASKLFRDKEVKMETSRQEDIKAVESSLTEKYELKYCRCNGVPHLFSPSSGKLWNIKESCFYGEHSIEQEKN